MVAGADKCGEVGFRFFVPLRRCDSLHGLRTVFTIGGAVPISEYSCMRSCTRHPTLNLDVQCGRSKLRPAQIPQFSSSLCSHAISCPESGHKKVSSSPPINTNIHQVYSNHQSRPKPSSCDQAMQNTTLQRCSSDHSLST